MKTILNFTHNKMTYSRSYKLINKIFLGTISFIFLFKSIYWDLWSSLLRMKMDNFRSPNYFSD